MSLCHLVKLRLMFMENYLQEAVASLVSVQSIRFMKGSYFINVSAQYLPDVHVFPQYTKLGKKIILLWQAAVQGQGSAVDLVDLTRMQN